MIMGEEKLVWDMYTAGVGLWVVSKTLVGSD